MSLGEVVRRRREQLKLTQDQVAGRVKISKPYLSNIETDRVKNPPTDGVLDRLEQVLDFPAGQLRRMAHLVRTPPDVRREHEELSAEVEKLRSLLKQLVSGGGEGRPRGLSPGMVGELKSKTSNIREMLSAGC